MPSPSLFEPRRSRNGAAYDFLSRFRALGHLAWLCRLASPFATRAEILAALPRDPHWATMVDLASWNGLLVSVYPALEEHDLRGILPGDALAAFAEFHAQARLRRSEAAEQIQRASRALNAAGIEPLWLKGAALIVSESPWAARRWMSDVDVWVAPERLDEALAVLQGMGYRHDPRQPDPSEHHLRPLFHDGETFAVELHHALVHPAVAGMMPLERVRGRALRVEWRGARMAIPHPLDQVVHLASQARPSAAAYLHGRLKVRRVVEFVQLASGTGGAGAAEAAEALASACREARQPEFGHEFLALASGLCGLPGDFKCPGAMAGIAWKTSFPRVHSLYFGFRGIAARGLVYHALRPRELARKVATHVRHSMDVRW